jgi:hypothetical protein
VFRLHSLGDSDHLDGESGRTAEEWVSTPSPASVSMVAGDSLSGQVRSVHDGTTPDYDEDLDRRLGGIRSYNRRQPLRDQRVTLLKLTVTWSQTEFFTSYVWIKGEKSRVYGG